MHLNDTGKIILDIASGVAPLGTTPIAFGVASVVDPSIQEIALYVGLAAAVLSIVWNGGRVVISIYRWLVQNDEEG